MFFKRRKDYRTTPTERLTDREKEELVSSLESERELLDSQIEEIMSEIAELSHKKRLRKKKRRFLNIF